MSLDYRESPHIVDFWLFFDPLRAELTGISPETCLVSGKVNVKITDAKNERPRVSLDTTSTGKPENRWVDVCQKSVSKNGSLSTPFPATCPPRNQRLRPRSTATISKRARIFRERWVRLNKRHESPIGFCENLKPTRPCVNYPLPNFSHKKLVFFGEIKKWFKASPDMALQKIL